MSLKRFTKFEAMIFLQKILHFENSYNLHTQCMVHCDIVERSLRFFGSSRFHKIQTCAAKIRPDLKLLGKHFNSGSHSLVHKKLFFSRLASGLRKSASSSGHGTKAVAEQHKNTVLSLVKSII